MFKNSVRLLLTNFSTVWKLLLYYCICFIVTVAICVPIASPIISKLTAAGVFNDINTVFTSIFRDPPAMITAFNSAVDNTAMVFSSNASVFVWNYVGLAFVLCVFVPFVFGLAELAVCETIYGFMSSNTQYGFTASFIKNFGKSVLLQLVKLIIIVPMNLLIFGVFVGIIKLIIMGGIVNILGSFIVFVLALIIIAIKQALFCNWVPAMVVQDVGPFASLKKGISISCRNYLPLLSTTVAFVLAAMVFNIFFGIFSFGTCLFITLPLTILVYSTFHMVSYFTCQGMRYYAYSDMVISPVTLEQRDKIDKTKYLL